MSGTRYFKILKNIFYDGNFHRIWQILLKSPLSHILFLIHACFRPKLYFTRKLLANSHELSSVENKILSELCKNGFANCDALFSNQDFASLEQYLQEKKNELKSSELNQSVHTKDFWVRLSDSDFAKGMTTDHPLINLSLNESLLRTISSYLGSAGFLEYVLLTYSTPMKSELKSSQLWHKDHDNDRMIKFFIYLSDVETTSDGPFTLLPKTENVEIKNSFFPKHLSDEKIGPHIKNKIEITGKKWTSFLVDTSQCYHMGSRVSDGHSRLMSTSLFVRLPKAYWGPLKQFVRKTKDLSPLQSAAVKA